MLWNLHNFFTSSKAPRKLNFIGLPRRLSRNSNNSTCFFFSCCHAFVTIFCHILLQESNATCANDKEGEEDVTRESNAWAMHHCSSPAGQLLYSECHFVPNCLGNSVCFLSRNFLMYKLKWWSSTRRCRKKGVVDLVKFWF